VGAGIKGIRWIRVSNAVGGIMGRRKKKSEDEFGALIVLVVFLIIIALVVVAIATPFVLVLGYIYNASMAESLREKLKELNKRKISDFWLNEEEKKTYKEKLVEIEQKERELEDINKLIEDTNRKGDEAGISRNLDGSFSARSKLGKELRRALKKYESIKRDLEYQLSRLRSQLEQLRMIPQERWSSYIREWNAFNEYLRRTKAFKRAIISYVITLVCSAVIFGNTSLKEILLPYYGLIVNFFRDEVHQIPVTNEDIYMIAVTTIVSIVVYFVSYMLIKEPACQYVPLPPPPPLVNVENIDEY